MKRLLMSFVAALVLSVPCLADTAIFNRSSFTQTSDAGVYISSSGYLDGVIVGVGSTGGVLKIYNSTSAAGATAASLISSITLSAASNNYFNNLQVKGIYYVADRNSNGFTILYKNR